MFNSFEDSGTNRNTEGIRVPVHTQHTSSMVTLQYLTCSQWSVNQGETLTTDIQLSPPANHHIKHNIHSHTENSHTY